MPLPSDFDTVEIHGSYVTVDGFPATGTITFTADVRLRSAATEIAVLPSAVTVGLDVDGHFSTNLPVTDDPDISPPGWVWRVDERFGDPARPYYQRSYTMLAPAGDPIDLTNVQPAVAPEVAPVTPWTTVVGKTPNAEGDIPISYTDLQGQVPVEDLPTLAINDTFVVADEPAMLALAAQRGDMAIRTDESVTFVLTADDPTVLANWVELATAPAAVSSVAGRIGDVVLTQSDVGLSNVDNTADADKPISTATQTAINTINTSLAGKVDEGDLVFNVTDYGAVGNGTTDDTAAINAAITAAGPTKGVVYFPPGTYRVATWTGTAGTISHRAITPLPGITLRGASRAASIIKVGNNVGDYFTVIGPPTAGTDLSGLTIESLTVDHNLTNNPVTNVGTMISSLNYRSAIVVYAGSRITIRDCRFTDTNAVWTTTVNSGGTDITICDNLYDVYGQSATSHDSSAIYTSGVRTKICGNTFVGVGSGGLGAHTAIETHGDNQIVEGNDITNFFRGMNITGVAVTSTIGVIVRGNVIRRCNVGIQLWSNTYAGNTSGWALRDVLVSDNVIEIDYDLWVSVAFQRVGILLDPTSNYGVQNLSIVDNTIRYLPFTTTPAANDFTSSGITYYRPQAVTGIADHQITISRNKIVHPPGPGIYIQPKAFMRRMDVCDNVIINPATGGGAAYNSAYRVGIKLQQMQEDLSDIRINHNQIEDDRVPAVMTAGVDVNNLTVPVLAYSGEALDNVVRCWDNAVVSFPVFKGSGTAAAAFYVTAHYDTTGRNAVTGQVLYGSRVVAHVSGVILTQTAAPQGTTWT